MKIRAAHLDAVLLVFAGLCTAVGAARLEECRKILKSLLANGYSILLPAE